MDIKSNMSFTGKRENYIGKYKAGVNSENKLQSVDMEFYTECGWSAAECLTLAETIPTAQGCYNSVAWDMKPIGVITDKPRGTAVRAPGTTQGHAVIENMMEHIAAKLGEDPIEFRIKNMLKEGQSINFKVDSITDSFWIQISESTSPFNFILDLPTHSYKSMFFPL